MEDITLLKEQNECLAKRCNGLEASVNELLKENSNLESRMTTLFADIKTKNDEISKLYASHRDDRKENARLSYIVDAVSEKALGDYNMSRTFDALSERYDTVEMERDILISYFIKHLTIKQIADAYTIHEDRVKRIIDADYYEQTFVGD